MTGTKWGECPSCGKWVPLTTRAREERLPVNPAQPGNLLVPLMLPHPVLHAPCPWRSPCRVRDVPPEGARTWEPDEKAKTAMASERAKDPEPKTLSPREAALARAAALHKAGGRAIRPGDTLCDEKHKKKPRATVIQWRAFDLKWMVYWDESSRTIATSDKRLRRCVLVREGPCR